MAVQLHPVLQIIPLIVLLGLMVGFKGKRAHPILAGFIAAFLGCLFAWGQLSISDIQTAFYNGVNGIMFSSVMLFAATALFIGGTNSIKAFIDLLRKVIGEKFGWTVPGIFIFLLGLVVYLAGHGAANILVLGPIIYSIVGWMPEVVAAVGIAASSSWTTSPASAETGVTAKVANIPPEQYYLFMRPFTVSMWLVATCLALYGSYKRRFSISFKPSQELLATSYSELLWKSLPFIVFIILVFLGPIFSISPVIILLTTLLVAFIIAGKDINGNIQKWAEANKPLLSYLFYAGVFLGFINVIGLIGTYNTVAGVVAQVPAQVMVIVAIIIGYILGMITGAYTAMTMSLIHPILVAAGIPWNALGFINYAIGLGAMTCPAQVSVSASAMVFNTDIPSIVRNNVKYNLPLIVIPIIMSLIALR